MTPASGIYRINGSHSVRRINSRRMSGVPWWLAGGIDPVNVAGVWKPKGAESLSTSYMRLAGDEGYPNIDPAIVGGIAPAWDAVNGWDFTIGDSYLDTGIVPGLNYTFIVRISDRAGGSYDSIIGQRTEANSNVIQMGNYNSINDIFWYYGNSNIYTKTVNTSAGEAVNAVFGMSKGKAYIDGILESTFGIPSVFSTNLSLYIGACNNYNGTAGNFSIVKIQSLSVYKSILTDAQVLAVSTRMAEL